MLFCLLSEFDEMTLSIRRSSLQCKGKGRRRRKRKCEGKWLGREEQLKMVDGCVLYWRAFKGSYKSDFPKNFPLKRDVAQILAQCGNYQLAKEQKQNVSLYTPLSISDCLW